MTPRLTASSFPMLRWQPAKAMQTSTGRRLLTLLIIPVVPGLGTRGWGQSSGRGVGIGFLVEFCRIRHEQDVIAAVRLIPKVPEGGALLHVAGDVANDRKAPPIRYEFLDDLAGNARVEPEEIVREPFHGNQDQTGFMLDRLGNQFDGIAVAPQFLPIRRAREHAYAMQIVGGCGHRIRWLSRRWFREHQGHYTSGLRCSHVRRCGWRAVLAPSLEDQKATLRIVLKFG